MPPPSVISSSAFHQLLYRELVVKQVLPLLLTMEMKIFMGAKINPSKFLRDLYFNKKTHKLKKHIRTDAVNTFNKRK